MTAAAADPPKYPFLVAVCGSHLAPPELVAGVLDRLLTAKRAEHTPVLLLAGGETPASDWGTRTGVAVQVEPVLWELYGHRYAPARWAHTVAAVADAVVVFGPEGPWCRLLRYARELNIPVRRIALPPGPPR